MVSFMWLFPDVLTLIMLRPFFLMVKIVLPLQRLYLLKCLEIWFLDCFFCNSNWIWKCLRKYKKLYCIQQSSILQLAEGHCGGPMAWPQTLSSPGLLWVKVWPNSRSREWGWKSWGWPRLGITLGVQETNWVQRQKSSIDPLHRFWSDRGNRGWE